MQFEIHYNDNTHETVEANSYGGALSKATKKVFSVRPIELLKFGRANDKLKKLEARLGKRLYTVSAERPATAALAPICASPSTMRGQRR